MLFHSSINAFLSCARVAGGFRCFLTLLSSSSHMCSIGVKSGLYGGNASGAMLLFAKLGQHVVGHCPAAESDYVVAQAGLQQDAISHPYTLLRSYCPGYFRWGSGDEFFLRMSLGSLSIAQMVDVVCTNVAKNALPTPVKSNGIGLGVAPLWSGEALLTG